MDKSVLRKAAFEHRSEIMQPYDTLLDLDGFDAICAFTELVGGLTIYVPQERTIFARCMELAARQEFTGSNFAALAKKYGYTERHMRRIVGCR